ncbi:hypothetical protein JYT34_01095 [Olleya sp. AH-315-K02]|nr:hypothetical protein [Olleya sp. AH-315-K02]
MSKTTIEEFKSNFNSKLNTIPTSNKSNLIDNEIKKIEKYLEPKEYYKRDKRHRFSNLNLNSNQVFDLRIASHYKNDFINAFNKYLLGEKFEITIKENEKNTADNITYLDGMKTIMKTKRNLNVMIKLFENECFNEITSNIKEDQNRIKQ